MSAKNRTYLYNVFNSMDRDPSTRWFESPREVQAQDDRSVDQVVQDLVGTQIAPGGRVYYSVWHTHPINFQVTAGVVSRAS